MASWRLGCSADVLYRPSVRDCIELPVFRAMIIFSNVTPKSTARVGIVRSSQEKWKDVRRDVRKVRAVGLRLRLELGAPSADWQGARPMPLLLSLSVLDPTDGR